VLGTFCNGGQLQSATWKQAKKSDGCIDMRHNIGIIFGPVRKVCAYPLTGGIAVISQRLLRVISVDFGMPVYINNKSPRFRWGPTEARGGQRVAPARDRSPALDRAEGRQTECAMLEKSERWIGPFQILKLLEAASDPNAIWPPERGSAYLVTQRAWRGNPKPASGPLYVGGITGKSDRFRTRIGDLLADSFGFYTKATGHSSGGKHLHEWCRKNRVRPLDLYLSWVEGTRCHRCLEVRLHRVLHPQLNRNLPSHCATHHRTPGPTLSIKR
jgi:hypothetical protein